MGSDENVKTPFFLGLLSTSGGFRTNLSDVILQTRGVTGCQIGASSRAGCSLWRSSIMDLYIG